MKKTTIAIAALAACAGAAPANATVLAFFAPGAASPSSGSASLQNFNNCTTASCSGLSGTNYIIQQGSNANGAQPAYSNPAGTNYLSVLVNGSATYTFANAVAGFQFDWGSIDRYNTLTVNYLTSANAAAQMVYVPGTSSFNSTVANGSQTSTLTNGLFTVIGNAGERFTSVNFANSTPNAFEVDNIAAVPEPATWAMMLLGFGMVGAVARRSRRQTSVSFG